jgi:hypothetical protein
MLKFMTELIARRGAYQQPLEPVRVPVARQPDPMPVATLAGEREQHA